MQGSNTESLNISCDSDRTDYVGISLDPTTGDPMIQMNWLNRVTNAFYDAYSFTCQAMSSDNSNVYYEDSFTVNSISCIDGLAAPNGTYLSCGT